MRVVSVANAKNPEAGGEQDLILGTGAAQETGKGNAHLYLLLLLPALLIVAGLGLGIYYAVKKNSPDDWV